MSAGNRCKCCKGLNSLAAECIVVTLTLVHVLLSAAELLIHLHIIQDPDAEDNSSVRSTGNNDTNISTSTVPSQSYDPGGCDNNLDPRLDDTVEIARYTTLVISAIFCIEIACKILLQKVSFFKDFWQVFDMLVVLLSLAAEIAFFLQHEKLLCYHMATEGATFVIVLRLWRIPRACDIRKKEYKKRLEDQHHFLRLTKTETEQKYKKLETTVQNQLTEIETYRRILKENNLTIKNEHAKTANGNGPFNKGLSSAANRVLHSQDNNKGDYPDQTNGQQADSNVNEKTDINKTAVDLERNDSDKNSRGNDSGIEEKDSFRSEREVTTDYKARNMDDEVFDSDGSEIPVPAKVQEVEVQIEEISRQKQLPSVTSYPRSSYDEDDDTVLLRRKSSSTVAAAAFINPTYDGDEPDVAGGTYRSADGIPMTEL